MMHGDVQEAERAAAKADAGAALLCAVFAQEVTSAPEVPGLSAWLSSLKLAHCDTAAQRWCQQNQMVDLAQVTASWEALADALQLRPLERHRVAKALNQSSTVTVLPAAVPVITFGPDEDPQRYQLLETVGSGATARVFRCADQQGKVLAVKRIKLTKLRRQGNYQQVEEMLHQEIAIHLSLQHPKVTGLVDVIESSEELHLVIEFLGGGSLDDVLGMRRVLCESQASDVFRQIAEGLHYIHMRGIAHRDLKPENVLVLDRSWEDPMVTPQVKLADFGHSKVVDDIFVRSSSHVGTPLYMAPEAFTLESLDERSADLWSLGVLLYVMLLGRCPFEGSGAELQQAIQKRDFTFFGDDAQTPPSTDAQNLIRALLKVDPRRRATLDWCLLHRFLVPLAQLGRQLLRDGLAAPAEDEILEESYILPSLPEAAIRSLRQDMCRWMLKFRFSAMTQGHQVVAKYGLLALAEWDRIQRAHQELLQVMAFHTNAKRPASGNVWERLRERGAQSARSRPSPGGEGEMLSRSFPVAARSSQSGQNGDLGPDNKSPTGPAENEDEDAARQRRLAARQKVNRTWNFTGRSGAKPTVDGDFRAQEAALERARRQAFRGRGYRHAAEDLER